MPDVVDQLRALSRCEHDDHSIGDEAAAEIARLRGEISYLKDAAIPALRKKIELMRALLSEALNFIESHDERDKAIDYIRRVERECNLDGQSQK